jgi:hypothetical protein
MSIFNIFKIFKSKKETPQNIEIEETQLEFSESIEEGIQEEFLESVEEEVQEKSIEPTNEVVEGDLDEISQLPDEDTKWIPMEEVMDQLKSKYQSYDLTLFLDFDYEKEGQKDGYNIHSSEFLKKKKMYLVSEFQRLIEKRVDELKDERLNCKNLIIDMRGLSDQLVEKFQLRVDLCNEYIEDLHKEKELSNGQQGLIRSVIADYEVGWDKGLSDYSQDNYFLNPLKRL